MIPPDADGPYVRPMINRRLLLVALHLGLLTLRPSWVVIDWSDPVGWLSAAPPDEAVAALLRSVAALLTGSQIVALTFVGLFALTGHSRLERAACRMLVPVFRVAGPIALVAGTALPAAAMEARIPITPPAVTLVSDLGEPGVPIGTVVVRPGDSMWTIAEDHVEGDPGEYWRQVVDLNRQRFEDVDVIHPGETVLLPPVSGPG